MPAYITTHGGGIASVARLLQNLAIPTADLPFIDGRCTPGAGFAGIIAHIEADGANWNVGSEVLRLTSDDNDATPLVVHNGANPVATINRAGLVFLDSDLQTNANLTLLGGGDLVSTAAGDVRILPDTTGITRIGDAGNPGHLGVPTNDDFFVSGRCEVDGVAYFDANIEAGINILVTGNVDVGGHVELTGGGDITSTANGDIRSLPNGSGITRIGDAGNPTRLPGPTNDDFFVSGRIEVDGVASFDALLTAYLGLTVSAGNCNLNTGFTSAGTSRFNTNVACCFGSAGINACLIWENAQTPDTLCLALDTTTRHIIMCESGDNNTDFGHAQETNPTFFGHSSDATDVNDFWGITHNQTRPVAYSGKQNAWDFQYGIMTMDSDFNCANPPTDANLDAAFGQPAAVGDGFIGVLDDNGADANVYLCVSNGTSWWYSTLTKAV